MTTLRPLLSVVSPVFNEETGIRAFYSCLRSELTKLSEFEWEILLVDDGSADRTLAVIDDIASRDPVLRVIALSRNFGHQVALSAGMNFAKGQAVVLMDADLQHPPALIPAMVSLWREGNDIVSAVRERTADVSLGKRLTSSVFYRVFNALSDTKLEPGAADFCLLSRRVCRAVAQMPERHRFLRGLIAWSGFRRALIPYDAPARQFGRSKYELRRMLSLGFNALFSFSVGPIRLAVRLGLVVAAIGAAYLGYILIRYILFGDLVAGWGSLMCAVLILGGLQIVFIGLIGEYVGRVYEQVKGRPLYLLRRPLVRRSAAAAKGDASDRPSRGARGREP